MTTGWWLIQTLGVRRVNVKMILSSGYLLNDLCSVCAKGTVLHICRKELMSGILSVIARNGCITDTPLGATHTLRFVHLRYYSVRINSAAVGRCLCIHFSKIAERRGKGDTYPTFPSHATVQYFRMRLCKTPSTAVPYCITTVGYGEWSKQRKSKVQEKKTRMYVCMQRIIRHDKDRYQTFASIIVGEQGSDRDLVSVCVGFSHNSIWWVAK